MRSASFLRLLAAGLAVLLSACGGSDDGRRASLTVSAAIDAVLNGVYSVSDIVLSDVERVNALDPNFDICRFNFAGLRQEGGSRLMAGTVGYSPVSPTRATHQLRVTVITIDGAEYSLVGSTNAAVESAADRINYAGAVFTALNGNTLTLSGALPMPFDRPAGC